MRTVTLRDMAEAVRLHPTEGADGVLQILRREHNLTSSEMTELRRQVAQIIWLRDRWRLEILRDFPHHDVDPTITNLRHRLELESARPPVTSDDLL